MKPIYRILCLLGLLLMAGQVMGQKTLQVGNSPLNIPINTTIGGWSQDGNGNVTVSYATWNAYSNTNITIDASVKKLTIIGNGNLMGSNVSLTAPNTQVVFNGTLFINVYSPNIINVVKLIANSIDMDQPKQTEEIITIDGSLLVLGNADFSKCTVNINGDATFGGRLTVGSSFNSNNGAMNVSTIILEGEEVASNLCTMLSAGKNKFPFLSLIFIDPKLVDGNTTNGEISKETIDCLKRFATVLPLHLLHFSASRTPMGVALNWKVNRDELLSFQVERSEDGQVFLPLGSVSGTYTYMDMQAPVSALWYRLRISNPKGEYQYSTMLKVLPQLAESLQVVVSPNPLQGGRLQAHIRSSKPSSEVQLRLFDLSGRLLSQGILRLDAQGQGQWFILPESQGLLLLQVTDGEQIQTAKVMM